MRRSQRAKGDGSFLFLKDRQMWRHRITINGRRYESVKRTKAEARDANLNRAKGRIEGASGELSASSQVRDIVEQFLMEKQGEGKAKTHQTRVSHMNLYILPHFGRIRLDKISTNEIAKWLKDLGKSGGKDGRGLSPQSVKTALKQARAVGQWAEDRELWNRNLFTLIKPPQVVKTVRAMNRSEWSDLRESIAHEPLRALVHVAVGSGLRSGELIGLSWDDLDLERDDATLTVRKTITRITGQGLIITSPKTKGSKRTLILDPRLVREIVIHRDRQEQSRRKQVANGVEWGRKFPKYRWVFANSEGNPLEAGKIRKEVERMCEFAGIEGFSVHELRHTCASFAIASGVQLKELSEMLGHASIRETSDTYGHLYPASRVETSKRIADYQYSKK